MDQRIESNSMKTDEVQVVRIVREGMDASYGIIETQALSSCICWLLDGMIGNKSFCFLYHSSKVDDNEADCPEALLVFLLTKLSDNVKECLRISSLSKNENTISNLTLLICGGAKQENELTRESFSLLNKNYNINLIQKSTNDRDVIHVAKELLNSIIVIRPITYLGSDEDDEKGKYYYTQV
jgi:hypothetical protein